AEVFDFEYPLRGTSSGYLSLRGTLEAPEISANIDATNLEFREFKSDRTNINLNYSNNRLDFELFITKDAKQIFQADGSADISLNLKEMKESLETAEFDLTLKSSGVDLSPIVVVLSSVAWGVGAGIGFAIVLVTLALLREELSYLFKAFIMALRYQSREPNKQSSNDSG
ncbi:MAG: hypothetical protein QW760_08405, partial [Thermofilaceae archaeon]